MHQHRPGLRTVYRTCARYADSGTVQVVLRRLLDQGAIDDESVMCAQALQAEGPSLVTSAMRRGISWISGRYARASATCLFLAPRTGTFSSFPRKTTCAPRSRSSVVSSSLSIDRRCMASLTDVRSGTSSMGPSASAPSSQSPSGWASSCPCGNAQTRAFHADSMRGFTACSPSRSPAFPPLLLIASSSRSNVARSPLFPLDVRHYAKAAPASKGGIGDAAGSKRHRRSTTRLFSCRNDRFRSAFEQIWPTLRLTGT